MNKDSEDKDLEDDVRIIVNLLDKANLLRNKVWSKPRQFLGYDKLFFSDWRLSGIFFACDAVSLAGAAQQMATQHFSNNPKSRRYTCWVAESDSLDASQGLSGGHKFNFDRRLEEIK